MADKNRTIVLISLLLMAVYSAHASAASWAELVYDAGVPPKTRENVERAVNAVDGQLTQYKISLRDKIKIVVTADYDSFLKAWMRYGEMSRAEAEEGVKGSAGASVGHKPIILIRGRPALNENPEEAFRLLPHEIFHQLQSQGYGKTLVPWLTEGSADLFMLEVLDTAGFGKVNDFIRGAEERICQAPAISDVRELADYNYQSYTSLAQEGYPVYEMSAVMAARLVQENGFEKIILFYQLLHTGTSRDKAFLTAFRIPTAQFLNEMNASFADLCSGR